MNSINALFHGENPTRTDYVLTYGVGLIGAAVVWLAGREAWSPLQQTIVAILALDVLGGVVANITRSTNVWYHEQSRWIGIVFVLVHIVQPGLIALFVDTGNWTYALGLYLYMLVATFVIDTTRNGDVQKPLAFALVTLGIVIFSGPITTTTELAWFAPAYLVKMLGSHAVNYYAVPETTAQEEG